MSSTLEFRRLHLPRPLDEQALVRLLGWLAAASSYPVVAFETRAGAGTVEHLAGVLPGQHDRLARSLSAHLPGVTSTELAESRAPVQVAGSVRIRPRTLGLTAADTEGTVRAMLAALAQARGRGELLVAQLILGPRLRPKNLPARIHDPETGLWDLLTTGPQPATAEVRLQSRARIGQPGFSAVLRLGASAPQPGRARRLLLELFAAVRTVQSPGVRVELLHTRRSAVDRASSPWRWPIRLGVSEIPALLGWPIGPDELPGVPPLHPRPLRAADALRERERVLARSIAAGDDRLLGVSAEDSLQHLLLLGPTGVGKSTALLHLIHADLDAGRAVAVIDPKRDLIEDVLALVPKWRWGDVVLLDAADTTSVTFNPTETNGRDPDVVADGLLAVFSAVFADGWGPRTSDILSAAIRTLTRANRVGEPTTLIDVSRLLTDARFRHRMAGLVSGDPGLAGFWSWYEALGPGGQAAVIAAPMNKLRQVLLRPALVRLLGDPHPAIDIRRIFDDRTILLVPLNEALVGAGTATLLGSLVVAELWNATQGRALVPPSEREPAAIVLDEAHRFLNLPLALGDALAVSRGLGVGWHLATQYRAQFPADLRAAVDSNARSVVAFQLQPDDASHYARTTPDLIAEDFQALGRYQAYLRLVTGGHPSSWALAETLPPPRGRHRPDVVRSASIEQRNAHLATEPAATEPQEPADSSDEVTTSRPGRKRRQP